MPKRENTTSAVKGFEITGRMGATSCSLTDWYTMENGYDGSLTQYRDLRIKETESLRSCGALIVPVEEIVVSSITVDEIRAA